MEPDTRSSCEVYGNSDKPKRLKPKTTMAKETQLQGMFGSLPRPGPRAGDGEVRELLGCGSHGIHLPGEPNKEQGL